MTLDEARTIYTKHYALPARDGRGPAIRPQIFHLNFVADISIRRIKEAHNEHSCWTEIKNWERHIRLYVASEMLCITDGVVP